MGVIPGGPADKSGIQAGDVIMTFSGLRVDSSEDLSRIVSTVAAGSSVTIGVQRKGHLLELNTQL